MKKLFVQWMTVIALLTAAGVTCAFTGESVALVNEGVLQPVAIILDSFDVETVELSEEQKEELSVSDSSEEESSSSETPSASSQASSVVVSNPDGGTPARDSASSYVSIDPISPDSSTSNPGDAKVAVAVSGTAQIYRLGDILPQIVAAEMGDRFCDEALKAQAVAAHSYILYYNNQGKAPVLPARTASQRVISATTAVLNVTVTYGGQPINAVYSASTAGQSRNSAKVWGGSLPYLTSVTSAYDYMDPNWGVQTTVSVSKMRQCLESYFGITLSDDPSTWFAIQSWEGNGPTETKVPYVDALAVYAADGTVRTVSGQKFRESVLNYAIRSAAFKEISLNGDNFVFTTYGYGHGVGMSQWGAHYYSTQAGYSYQQILQHYYPGTTVTVA